MAALSEEGQQEKVAEVKKFEGKFWVLSQLLYFSHQLQMKTFLHLPPSPFSARLLLTIITIRHNQVPIGLVFSIYDSTEIAIQKMINASQVMLETNIQGGDGAAGAGMNPVMKGHLELEIKTLQNAPRDEDKLRRLLKVKERQKEEAMHIEDTERLVTEIEMLKVVFYLVSRKQQQLLPVYLARIIKC
jgi:hypothetical protein